MIGIPINPSCTPTDPRLDAFRTPVAQVKRELRHTWPAAPTRKTNFPFSSSSPKFVLSLLTAYDCHSPFYSLRLRAFGSSNSLLLCNASASSLPSIKFLPIFTQGHSLYFLSYFNDLEPYNLINHLFVFLEFAASCLFATSAMTRSPPQFVFSESRRVPDLSQGRCCILRCTILKECESLQFVCLS